MSNEILQELADKRALDELVYRMTLAVDQHDWATYRGFFEEEVDIDISAHTDRILGKGFGSYKKREDWVDLIIQAGGGFDCTQHMVSNVHHKLHGDRADTECHVHAEHFLNNDGGDRSISVGCIYKIGSVRSAAGWRLKTWRLTPLWYRGNPSLYRLAAERSQSKGTRHRELGRPINE